MGGGIRSFDDIKKLLDFGIEKVIIGTAAIEDSDFFEKACNMFKNKIALSIDVRKGYIALSGWKKQTDILAHDFIKKIGNMNITRIIYTDIDKDGTKTGPNIQETISLLNLTNIPIVISGGVASIDDVLKIKKNHSNIGGVIIGKAIYDGNINAKELSKLI